jgi:hypothetical protein
VITSVVIESFQDSFAAGGLHAEKKALIAPANITGRIKQVIAGCPIKYAFNSALNIYTGCISFGYS